MSLLSFFCAAVLFFFAAVAIEIAAEPKQPNAYDRLRHSCWEIPFCPAIPEPRCAEGGSNAVGDPREYGPHP